MRLRDAVPSDADEIARYHTAAWQAGYRGLLPQADLDTLDVDERAASTRELLQPENVVENNVSFTVATEDGNLLGHVLTRIHGPGSAAQLGQVVQLYVDPKHWGQGYGAALLQEGMRSMREAECRRAELWTIEGNHRAIALYERHGWRLDGRAMIEHVFGIESPHIALSIDLDAPT